MPSPASHGASYNSLLVRSVLMGLSELPPVRSLVPLHRCSAEHGRELFRRLFPAASVELLSSGTQSLGLAISRAACRRRSDARKAIIPAYGCPDLVTACIQAGVEPRLVDVAAEGWGYDPDALHGAVAEGCVAIVAVNFLGVGDDFRTILDATHGRDVPIIHDSAQSVPTTRESWVGDIVLSFGRGKPLNLLYGGALVSSATQQRTEIPARRSRLLDSRAAAVAFNLLTHPFVYHWAKHVPLFQVGETRYRPPSELERLPDSAFSRIGAALEEYLDREWENPWLQVIDEWASKGIIPLCKSPASANVRLLRMPLLARSRGHRDRVVALLNQGGVGASPMYMTSLPKVAGVPQSVLRQGPFRNADRLAERLLTLPTHVSVNDRHVAIADRCIQKLT